MITVRPQQSLRNARLYFREHLLSGDYYSQGQTTGGVWFGKGVERLAREARSESFAPGQPVRERAYLRLCENRHPVTGAKLTVRSRKDRRVFYDFTISALKSVSFMAITMGDERIVAAHDNAAHAAMVQLERVAGARIRKGRTRSQRTTGEIVAATFRHDSSRALDPQLHTHCLVFNATWDAVEGRWKALEPSTMFELTKFCTEVYRNVLAGELRRIGYELRTTANGFEIAGVSEAILQRFSKRQQAIAAVEAKLAEQAGQALTNNGRAGLARSTRQRKRKGLTSAELVAWQRSQLAPEELAELERLIPGTSQAKAPAPRITAAEAIGHARAHLFERLSVVREKELLQEALVYARGDVALDALEAELAKQNDLIRVGDALTSQEALKEERRMVALVNQNAGRCRPLNPRFVFTPELTDEQRQAATALLTSPDGVVCLRGGAGTGKTFVLSEIVRGIEAGGHQVAAFAPSAAAVEVLRHEGFGSAQTVQTLLVSEAAQRDVQGKVILVDEAGLLANKQMLALLELADRAGSRVILSGDVRQHSSVEAGDALRVLERHSVLQTVALSRIRRQKVTEYRTAITEIAAGQPARAFVRLQRLGAVMDVTTEERYRHLAAEYAASVASGKTALIVAPTLREGQLATGEVRQRLKANGTLKPTEATVEVHVPMHWTEAQKRDLRNYTPGQVLLFHRATRDFVRGESARVTRVQNGVLTVTKRDGVTTQITRRQSRCFEVAQSSPLRVAEGEQLLIQGNRRDARLLNGQIVTVKEVKPDGTIALANGRTIPPDFRSFNYGYCVTSQKAQGKTVDRVFIAVDSCSGQAANLKQFYVSASRGREQLRIYTDDVDWLRDQIMKAGTRTAALELVEGIDFGRRHRPHVAEDRAEAAGQAARI